MGSVSDRIRRGKEGGQKFSGLGTPQGYSKRDETTASTAKASVEAPAVAAVKPTETPIAKTKREGTFGEAFAAARKKSGSAGEFEYRGKKYNTRTKEEEAERVAKTKQKRGRVVESWPVVGSRNITPTRGELIRKRVTKVAYD